MKKGSNVKNLQVGDRIAVENHFFCGSCHQCQVSKSTRNVCLVKKENALIKSLPTTYANFCLLRTKISHF